MNTEKLEVPETAQATSLVDSVEDLVLEVEEIHKALQKSNAQDYDEEYWHGSFFYAYDRYMDAVINQKAVLTESRRVLVRHAHQQYCERFADKAKKDP